jgi:hypothetical protein
MEKLSHVKELIQSNKKKDFGTKPKWKMSPYKKRTERKRLI